MRVIPFVRICRDKAVRCAKIAEHHSHLLYLTVGTMELHGLAAAACGGCLVFGVAVELLRFAGVKA